jgi:hypothetical protein
MRGNTNFPGARQTLNTALSAAGNNRRRSVMHAHPFQVSVFDTALQRCVGRVHLHQLNAAKVTFRFKQLRELRIRETRKGPGLGCDNRFP